MALGCAFIFLLILMLWRRRARKQRAKHTAKFAAAKNFEHKGSWRWRLVRLGEKLFGHRASKRVVPDESEDIKLMRLRDAEEARHNVEMEKLIGSYQHSTHDGSVRSSHAPSTLPSIKDGRRRRGLEPSNASQLSGPSLYSQITGKPRQTPETRQPVKKELLLSSRLSTSTYASSSLSLETGPTVAEAYAAAVRPTLAVNGQQTRGAYWLEPTRTGGSSNNPFRILMKCLEYELGLLFHLHPHDHFHGPRLNSFNSNIHSSEEPQSRSNIH